VQRGRPVALATIGDVSILTRPEGRVQLSQIEGRPQHPHVSILTRPEGRVQLLLAAVVGMLSEFQSSPVPKDGCNVVCPPPPFLLLPHRFNPHPSRRTGATYLPAVHVQLPSVSILTRPEGRVQLDPPNVWAIVRESFNPHPSRRTGATNRVVYILQCAVGVSILTRPEGRVQQQATLPGIDYATSFNPHPSRRTGATPVRYTSPISAQVSILTRPEGRVQLSSA